MTDIIKSFSVSALQSELDLAKNTLKGVDENIKRLIGRDPSELPARPPAKRNNNFTQVEERGRSRNNVTQNEDRRFKNSRLRMFVQENEEPPVKKRTTGISVFKRLSDRPVHVENQSSNNYKGMISKVIVTPKEIPSRQERMEAQSRDVNSIARNRRMFGALLGTLQKFQQEETKLKKKEDKRAQLEKKIEEHEIKEKEEIKKERQELFFNRKKKQAEIKMIELKMIRMKEYATWEESQKNRMNFIFTKTKPQIHFLPRRLNEAHKALLESSRSEIQNTIDKKREQVQEELFNIEERGKRIYETRKFQQEGKDPDNEEHDHENGIEDDDINMEDFHPTEEKEQEKSEEVKSLDVADQIGNVEVNSEVQSSEEKSEEVPNGDISANKENSEEASHPEEQEDCSEQNENQEMNCEKENEDSSVNTKSDDKEQPEEAFERMFGEIETAENSV